MKATDKHYVDNAKLTEELIKYAEACRESMSNGGEKPRMSEYLGAAIWDISSRYSRKSNFIGYSTREDMIGDGVENCVRYLHNFDPSKCKGKPNGLAYITQIIHYAFVRKIKREKKQRYVKHRLVQSGSHTLENCIVEGEKGTNSQIRQQLDELSKLNQEDFTMFDKPAPVKAVDKEEVAT